MRARGPIFRLPDTGPPRGPYDPDPPDDADLWFLPAPDDPGPEPRPGPGPRPAGSAPCDPEPWARAEAALARPLADLACLFGALDERLRAAPGAGGWRQRLALLEVTDLGWWTGDRIGADRLALWDGLRIGAMGDDAQALTRAGWALRRLTGGGAPDAGGWAAGLAAFLGRAEGDAAPPDNIADLADLLAPAGDLHPVTQAAILFHGWRRLGAQGEAREQPNPAAIDTEAAVIAARHAAGMGRGAALFLPLALTGPGALRATGTEAARLDRWIAGATQATRGALLHLDRIQAWQTRAESATADLSGRTPGRLIAALAAAPMLTAALAEAATGASRAAVQRNLDLLQARGLIREVTGAGRFRVWTAVH